MTKRDAKRLAYALLATELNITIRCGTVCNDERYPADANEQARVDTAIQEIIQSLADRGLGWDVNTKGRT